MYLLEAFVLLVIAKWAYTSFYRRVHLKEELFDKGNAALAVSTAGYLFGIVIALGGVLLGPSAGWQADLTAIGLYGLMTIAMMLAASWLCEKVLLSRFDNTKEVVEDQNLGTAFVEAGVHIANGLILLAIQQGAGPWWAGLVFWALAQAVLLVLGRIYEMATPHSVHDELERDNAAVGLALAGALVGMGNIISLAVAGDFTGWKDGLTTFGADAAFGPGHPPRHPAAELRPPGSRRQPGRSADAGDAPHRRRSAGGLRLRGRQHAGRLGALTPAPEETRPTRDRRAHLAAPHARLAAGRPPPFPGVDLPAVGVAHRRRRGAVLVDRGPAPSATACGGRS